MYGGLNVVGKHVSSNMLPQMLPSVWGLKEVSGSRRVENNMRNDMHNTPVCRELQWIT